MAHEKLSVAETAERAEAKAAAKALPYTEEIWRGGRPVYFCKACPVDTTTVERMMEHQQKHADPTPWLRPDKPERPEPAPVVIDRSPKADRSIPVASTDYHKFGTLVAQESTDSPSNPVEASDSVGEASTGGADDAPADGS